MLSNIKPFRILVVEDDKFKLDSVVRFLREFFGEAIQLTQCGALSSATSEVAAHKFDVVIIDMSIPSHEAEVGAGSPIPLLSGGLDVLFEVHSEAPDAACVILTQYPDITIEGQPIPLAEAAAEIKSKFDISVAGCVQYSESTTAWKAELLEVLTKP